MAQETHGERKPANKPGLYKHTESGAELTATSTPVADGLVRAGYVLVDETATKESKSK